MYIVFNITSDTTKTIMWLQKILSQMLRTLEAFFVERLSSMTFCLLENKKVI